MEVPTRKRRLIGCDCHTVKRTEQGEADFRSFLIVTFTGETDAVLERPL